MTVQLNWPPEVVDRLSEEARQKGLSLDDYVLQTVPQPKTPTGPEPSEEADRRQAREQAGRSIRELRKGNVLGPDVSIRDLLDEGHRILAPSFSNSVRVAWCFED